MIRRWSRINAVNTNDTTLFHYRRRLRIKNFRSVVNYKKFIYGRTRIKRRAIARFKHNTSWLIFFSFFREWIKDCAFVRRYAAPQFMHEVLPDAHVFYNFSFVKIRNEFMFYSFNFVFSVWPKHLYRHLCAGGFRFFANNNITFAWARNVSLDGRVALPAYTVHRNDLVPCDYDTDAEWFYFFDAIFLMQLLRVVELRKILIMLLYRCLK